MSEIKGNKKIVGKINAQTLRATTTVPDWLQPLIKENGVYVGTEEPTDPTKLVWINPDGEASDLDLSNYYTKDETDSLIDTAVQNIDLSSYATKVELENYDTSEQVDAKINAIEIPEGIQHITVTDASELLNLETGLYIVDNVFIVNTLQGEVGFSGTLSVKKDWHAYTFIDQGTALLYNDGDATWNCIQLAFKNEIPDVSGFALKTEIPTKAEQINYNASTSKNYFEIPGTLQEAINIIDDSLTNNTTNINAINEKLSDYALKTEIPEGIQHITITDATELLNLENGLYIVDGEFNVETISYQQQSFGGLMSVNWHSYIFINYGATLLYNDGDATWDCIYLAFRSEIPSVEGLATQDYVNEKIASIPEVDLSGYALKSEIPDVSGFLTAVPEEYVTESELNAKGYLTEHQSLADYSTTTQVQSMIDTAIAGITDGEAVSY